MSDRTGSTPDDSGDSDGPMRLRNAQRRIRDAYFDHDAGLFVLNCNPGVGKSTTLENVEAEELLRRYVDGDPTPEQHICVISFARDDAASFVPELVARLRELVKHDLTPAAAAVSEADVEYLVQRVRRAPFIGTIDSLFRSLLGEFVTDVGFDAMPAVGNTGQLDRLHADCYEAVAEKPANATAIDVVEAAYPTGEDDYDDGPAALLRQAHHQCRTRRLTTAAFRAELHDTVAAVYAEGETTSMSDIADALARCVGTDAATAVCADLDEVDREALVSADRQLHAAWRETIDAFCTLLKAYREAYATRIRERGVISHTDCAFLVAEFLTGQLDTTDTADAKRDRVLARYRNRIESVLIDEAQDVSELQHAGLAPLITAECRVLTAGDLRQSIYGFRDAHPSIFQQAAEDGHYFGIDWDPHVTETAATTYRCTPDVAGAINAIAEPALTDATRGNLGELDVTFPPLDPARDPVAEPNIHIAAFTTTAQPGTPAYVAPDDGKGEAGILATYIAAGLADGTLTAAGTPAAANSDGKRDTADGRPTVVVLFRWRAQMARYTDAFEAEGLTVANTADYLFECPVVTTVFNVAAWVADHAESERLQALVTDSSLGLATLADAFDACDWRLDPVREDADVTDEQRDVLARLHQLREMRATFRAQSAATSIADIIETLGLRVDPDDMFPTVTPAQRVANLDALVHFITQWEQESVADLEDVVDVCTPVQENPHTGPTQPVPGTDDHDVVFKLAHQAKGNEYDVVALADLGWSLRKLGPTSQRFVATGPIIGLAPPLTAAVPSIDSLGVFTRGLYDPTDDDSRFGPTAFPGDVGLRWASERWTDPHSTDERATGLAGHDRVQAATRRTRAEAYRILYVALTRAEQHLVVPLPRAVPGDAQPRDRWLEPIRDGLGFDGTPASGSYTLDVELADGATQAVDVAVNDVKLSTMNTLHDQTAPTATPFASTTLLNRDDLPPLVPRILRPSTLHPLSDDQDRYLLNHLQGRPLHTDADTVADDLPLVLDAFDTETVGEFVHGVLTTAVEQGVSADGFRTPTEELQQIIDNQLDRYGPPVTDAERDGLLTFLTESVFPKFVESTLWAQLNRADEVYVETCLRSHVRRNGVEFEIEGVADFVLHNPDDSWTITDLKIALTDPTPETRYRYQVQVACYAWLLATTLDVDDPTAITTTVETFGAVTDRTVDVLSPSIILDRLDQLINGGS